MRFLLRYARPRHTAVADTAVDTAVADTANNMVRPSTEMVYMSL